MDVMDIMDVMDVMDVIGTQRRINFPDLLDQLAPRSWRNAPQFVTHLIEANIRQIGFSAKKRQSDLHSQFRLVQQTRTIFQKGFANLIPRSIFSNIRVFRVLMFGVSRF